MATLLELPLASPSFAPTGRPGEALARFWSLAGQSVFEHDGGFWRLRETGLLTSLPSTRPLAPAADEIAALLRDSGAMALRYPSLVQPGISSGAYVLRLDNYGLHQITRAQQDRLEHGLAICEYRPVEKHEILPFTGPVLADAAFDAPGVMVRGVYHRDRLAAFAIACPDDGHLHILHRASLINLLRDYSLPAFDFRLADEAATLPGIRYLSHGSVPRVFDPERDLYLRSMGFDLRTHRRCIHLRPRS